MICRGLFAIFLMYMTSQVMAQTYDAPKIECVHNVTSSSIEITWQIPTVACGSFNSYKIYTANSATGPFTLLTTITNQSQNSYIQMPVNATIPNFYYMESDFNCTGLSSKKSDTVENIVLPTPVIKSVSIENNVPVINWEPVVKPQIYGYQILQKKNVENVVGFAKGKLTRTMRLDTIDAGMMGPFLFSIDAQDSCGGNQGTSSAPFYHKTIYLTKIDDVCLGSIKLSWNAYNGWTTSKYRILVNKNNTGETVIQEQQKDNLSYIYTDFDYGDSLKIRIEAVDSSDTTIVSHSNQYIFKSTKVQRPKLLQVTSVSYLSNYVARITWFCDSNAQYDYFELIKYDGYSKTEIGYTKITKPIYTSGNFFSYIDSNASSTSTARYEVVFVDKCNDDQIGRSANSLFAKVKQTGLFKNEISWNESLFPDSVQYTISSYSLYVDDGSGNYSLLTTLPSGTLSYSHDIESLYQSKGQFCYYVVAHYTFDTTTQLLNYKMEARSEFACIEDRTVIHIPNAFKTTGVTPTFKPMFVFWNGNGFLMQIYNRWGTKIYETTNANYGWDGSTINGQATDEGMYSYIISFIGNDGKSNTKTGTVILLK
jgi:hypothetical protein